MTSFLQNVAEKSSQAGGLTLEEKIERLQRRLGGQPLPIESHLSQLDTEAIIARRVSEF